MEGGMTRAESAGFALVALGLIVLETWAIATGWHAFALTLLGIGVLWWVAYKVDA